MDIFASPMVNSMAFHPRAAKKHDTAVSHAVDGGFKLPETDPNTGSSVSLGYRLYPYPYGSGPAGPSSRPLVLYFHGNAEVCSDYDGLHKYFHDKLGVSLMVVDYRGYGWGTSEPSLMTLQSDARHVLAQLDSKLEEVPCTIAAGIGEVPIILFGRSIGSVCAIHLARFGQKTHSGEVESASPSQCSAARRIKGIILESPICSLLELPMVQQLGSMIPSLTSLLESGAISDPWDNKGQIQRIHLPLIIIHGEKDEISPVHQGLQLFNEAGTAKERKTKMIFSKAGHNDLTSTPERLDEYFQALYRFISAISSDEEYHPAIESGAGKSPRGDGRGGNQSREEAGVSQHETEQCGCNVS